MIRPRVPSSIFLRAEAGAAFWDIDAKAAEEVLRFNLVTGACIPVDGGFLVDCI